MQTLPEIITGLMGLLESQGHDAGGGEEAWAQRGKCLNVDGLEIDEEGYRDCGPYRLTVYTGTTEESIETEEPLLRLEIRPGLLWINEVKRLIAGPPKPEPIAAG